MNVALVQHENASETSCIRLKLPVMLMAMMIDL